LVEHEQHAHHHNTGISWLDGILAGSAILISVVSLVVSVHHGRTMENLVEANERQVKAATLPILRFTTGNFDISKRLPAAHLDLTNGGTGPAIIEWLALQYKGQPIRGPESLLRACCGPGKESFSYIQNSASGQTLGAGQSLTLLEVPQEGNDPAIFKALAGTERYEIRARACFCSVLEECSILDFEQRSPRPVKSCEAERPKNRSELW